MPKVSIIIPTYNQEQLVSQTVDSALAQVYPDFEVIVVDDGSTDNTRAVLARYGNKIRYIFRENRGPAAARNTGFLASHGDYLLFLDGDDLIPPNKLERQVSFLEAQPEFGLVYSAWQVINENGTQILAERSPKKEGHLLKDLLRRTLFFSPGAAVAHRKCFHLVGLFDESLLFCSDMDIMIRIAKAGYAFGYIDEFLFQYRLATGSMSSNIAKQSKDEFARHHKFFADPELPDDTKSLEAELFSMLHYEFAAKYYNVGEFEMAQDHIRTAISRSPSLASDEEWLLEWIAGYALDGRVNDPYQLINRIFGHLPSEAATLCSLRRRAFGRYHIAAAFAAYQNHQLGEVRQNILPALINDPAIIRNRGFLNISLRSLFG